MSTRSNRNVLPDLISLETWLKPKGKRLELLVDLRAETAEFEAEGLTVEVSATAAILDISFEGLEFCPGPRLGEPSAEKKVVSATTVEHTLTAGAQIAAQAESSTLAAKANGNAGLSGKYNRTTKSADEEVHLPVRALPNGRWRISEPRGDRLASTFLDGKSICQVDHIDRANRKASLSRIKIKQKDLLIEKKGTIFQNMTTNKDKILSILIAKSIAECNDSEYLGSVVFCRSEVELEENQNEE